MVQKKINVGIFFPQNNQWTGEVNYFISLISSLKLIKDPNYNFFIFCGKDNEILVKSIFNKNKQIISSHFFQRKTLQFLIRKLLAFFLDKDVVINLFLKKFKINIVSHYIPLTNVKNISWFPDFQHFFLKKNFTNKEILRRDKLYNSYIFNSDILLVSSKDSMKHLKIFNNKITKPIEILNFVPNIDFKKITNFSKIKNKYLINSNYFYIPNQFWPHKNHKILIKVAKYFKKKKINLIFVFSGKIQNAPNNYSFEEFNQKLKKYNLESYFTHLGMIPYKDVINLIYYSRALINPSYFEGWSTTVEEAKILNKKMILSNLDVHKEQGLKSTQYFNPNDYKKLVKLIIANIDNKKLYKISYLEDKYKIKRKEFSNNFYKIIKKIYI